MFGRRLDVLAMDMHVEWSGVVWGGVEWSGVEWGGGEWNGYVQRDAARRRGERGRRRGALIMSASGCWCLRHGGGGAATRDLSLEL